MSKYRWFNNKKLWYFSNSKNGNRKITTRLQKIVSENLWTIAGKTWPRRAWLQWYWYYCIYEQAREIDQKIKYVFISSLISHYDFKNDKIAINTLFTSAISILNILENDPIFTQGFLPVGYYDKLFISSKILNSYIEHIISNYKNINKI